MQIEAPPVLRDTPKPQGERRGLTIVLPFVLRK